MQNCSARWGSSLSLRFRTLERCQSNPGGPQERSGRCTVWHGGNLWQVESCPVPRLRLDITWAVIDCLYGWRHRWGQDYQRDQNISAQAMPSHYLPDCSFDVTIALPAPPGLGLIIPRRGDNLREHAKSFQKPTRKYFISFQRRYARANRPALKQNPAGTHLPRAHPKLRASLLRCYVHTCIYRSR